jgi:hypothetical protein
MEYFVEDLRGLGPGDARGVVISGHGTLNKIYFNMGNLNDETITWSPLADKVRFRYGGKEVELSELNLGDKGLETILLRSCNSAGGVPGNEQKRRQYPDHEHWYPDPTDENITNAFARQIPGTIVGGQRGLWLFEKGSNGNRSPLTRPRYYRYNSVRRPYIWNGPTR